VGTEENLERKGVGICKKLRRTGKKSFHTKRKRKLNENPMATVKFEKGALETGEDQERRGHGELWRSSEEEDIRNCTGKAMGLYMQKQ
jgi:hypothetical protein